MASGVPMKTKIEGIVKAVVSGDTVVIVKPGVPKTGPPPEVRVTLSSLKAPSLKPFGTATAVDSAPDEDYAWAAREFLRRKLIRKPVVFIVEYKVMQLNRSMGSIFVADENGEMKSVSKMVVSEGYANVRRPNNPKEDRSFEFDDLCALEDEAKEQKKNIHSGRDMPSELGRTLLPTPDTVAFLQQVRGKKMEGVVDFILNGSAFKVLFPEEGKPGFYRSLTVCLSGVQCPGFRRAEGKLGEEGAAPPPLVAMPFALNAKFFSEQALLHRDAEVVFEGADKVGNLYAQISAVGQTSQLAEDLLRLGFAKTVGWSMEFSSNSAMLRSAEKTARDARTGVWINYVPDPNAAVASSDVFMGRVVEVVSGDILVVADDSSGEFRRVCFASIRAPKLGRGGDKDAPGAWEAREYLRKRLIGRRIKVQVDYQRKPPPESPYKETMTYATITREKAGKDSVEEDIGMALVAQGFVTVMRHRTDEERARHYDEYVQAEKDATNAKKGIHSVRKRPYPNQHRREELQFLGGTGFANRGTDSGIARMDGTSGCRNSQDKLPAVRRVNDITGPENKKRSKEMLSSFSDSGPHRGILEHASTGSRFRIFLTKDSCLIQVALKGVRSPTPARTGMGQTNNGQQTAGDPFGNEALHFTKLSFLQRDVLVDITSVDRTGAYLGTVRLPNAAHPSSPETDVGLTLLANGYAMLNEFFDPSRDEGGEEYVRVQAEAKNALKGLWKDQKPREDARAAQEAQNRGVEGQVLSGTVVEVGFGGRLFLHAKEGSSSSLRTIEEALANLTVEAELPIASLKSLDIVAAKFSADGLWYRSKVLTIDQAAKAVKVRFADYGNEEWVPLSDLTKLPGTISSIPRLATEVGFLYLVVPGEGEELAVEAGEMLRELVYGKQVKAAVSHRDATGVALATITVNDQDIGAEMLRRGIARLIRQRSKLSKEAFSKYVQEEDKGRQSRAYLWRYGDPYASDEDDSAADKEMRERRYGGVPRR